MRTTEYKSFACQLAVEKNTGQGVLVQLAYDRRTEFRVTGALGLTK